MDEDESVNSGVERGVLRSGYSASPDYYHLNAPLWCRRNKRKTTKKNGREEEEKEEGKEEGEVGMFVFSLSILVSQSVSLVDGNPDPSL